MDGTAHTVGPNATNKARSQTVKVRAMISWCTLVEKPPPRKSSHKFSCDVLVLIPSVTRRTRRCVNGEPAVGFASERKGKDWDAIAAALTSKRSDGWAGLEPVLTLYAYGA